MAYELRQQVIEQKRPTFQNLIERYGNKPASRYLEGTVDVQARENFHYRPLWDPSHELYDEGYSKLRLTDPYSFLDPRQYYYFPYVAARAKLHEDFGQTLGYLAERGLIDKLPEAWRHLLTQAVVPMRHYEQGAQLLESAGTRFAYGTSISQCCSFAAFDRIGNAQILSRVGLALTEDGASLATGKQAWMEDDSFQPLRKLLEFVLIEPDWAEGVVVLALLDAQIYPLLYRHLDEAALLNGAGAYSLIAQHLATWYQDDKKWFTALVKCWLEDAEHGADNRGHLDAIGSKWLGQTVEAVNALAGKIDQLVPGVDAEAALNTDPTLDALLGVSA